MVMITADRKHLVRRLQELRGWADFIVESLTNDQPYETGKREMLGQALDPRALKELREIAWSLRDRLDRSAVQLDLTSTSLEVPP